MMRALSEHEQSVRMKIKKANPYLWRFLDPLPQYAEYRMQDSECKKWTDTLNVAYFMMISRVITSELRFDCTAGKMSMSVYDEWEDHNSESHSDSYTSSVRLIDRETYLRLKRVSAESCEPEEAEKRIKRDYLYYVNVGDAGEYLEEYCYLPAAVIRREFSSHDDIGLAARVKGIDGYFCFGFYKL